MIDPNDIIECLDIKPITSISINNLPKFDMSDYDLNDEKDRVRHYFTNIEKICRNSIEYKNLIYYLRTYSNMNQCSFFENINNIDTYSIKIHIHHSPLTLFDIVTIIFYKRFANHESLSDNAIAKEVMYNHYKMNVGLIPLSETVHDLVHNQYLFIPVNKVYGSYKNFIKKYEGFIDNPDNIGLSRKLENAEKYTESYDYEKSTRILNMNMVFIDPSGAYDFPNYDQLRLNLKNQINNSISTDQKFMSNKINTGKKIVVEIVPEEQREQMREHYGIKKVL